MDVLVSKVSSLFILAVSTTLAGLLPLKLKKPHEKKDDKLDKDGHSLRDRVMNAILAFSGGVLFSTIFIHLMPDVDAGFDKIFAQTQTGLVSLSETSPKDTVSRPIMPWGQLTICGGFFVIYALEELVEYLICRSCEEQHHHHADSPPEDLVVRQVNQSVSTENSNDVFASARFAISDKIKAGSSNCFSPVHGTHGAHRPPHQVRDCNKSTVSFDDVILDEKTPLFQSSPAHKSYNKRDEEDSEEKDTCQIIISAYKDDNHDGRSEPAGHSHAHHESKSESSKVQEIRNTMRGLMLIVALSFHSIFEGMAIGLQSTVGGIWTSFMAVTLHKLVMGFCAGVELVTLGTKRKTYLLSMITFALICPIGIAIGTIVTAAVDGQSTNDSSTPSLVIAILQGLACGTLLYVTFFEVLTRTKGNEMSSFINFVAVLCGFALITGLHLID